MAFKSLNDAFIFKHLNQNNVLSNNIANIMNTGKLLTQKDLEEAFIIINKNFKFPLKYNVLDDVAKGGIELRYSMDNKKLPTCMPFFLTRNNEGKVIAVIAVDIYGNMNKENGSVTIDAKKLYCLLEAAYIAKICFINSQHIVTRNIVITNGSAIYSNIFTKVLNKKYALNVDKTKMHKILFLTSKFYLINMLGLNDNEMTFNYAIKNCLNANPYSIKEVNDIFQTEDFNDFSTFIQALANPEYGLGLTDLSVRNYLEAYINMFDASALLALESFPYFMYNVIAVLNGAYINNQYSLEDIIEKNGAKLYTDIISLK